MTMSDELRDQRTMLLTTYRRNDSPVGTPVNVAVGDEVTFAQEKTTELPSGGCSQPEVRGPCWS